MTVEIRPADLRSRTLAEGRTTRHSFAFGAHYDPLNVGFGALVAHNDEHLPPGTGYAEHPHADLEIVTWVLSGALRHESTAGSGLLLPGGAQRLSAGSGVRHSEVADYAAADGVTTRFLQAWVRPDTDGTPPDYRATDVGHDLRPGAGWTCLAAGPDRGPGRGPGRGQDRGALPIAARGASLHVARVGTDERLALAEADLLHVFVAAGQLMLGERRLGDGDAARLTDEGGRSVRAEQEAHVVVWAFTAR